MRVRHLILVLLCVISGATVLAQGASVRIEVRSEAGPVAGADVIVNSTTHQTDAKGIVVVNVPPGPTEIVVVKDGFAPASASVQISPNEQQPVVIDLTR